MLARGWLMRRVCGKAPGAHLLCGLPMAPQPLRLPGLLPQQLAAPLEQVAPLGAHPLLHTGPEDGKALSVRKGEALSCRDAMGCTAGSRCHGY